MRLNKAIRTKTAELTSLYLLGGSEVIRELLTEAQFKRYQETRSERWRKYRGVLRKDEHRGRIFFEIRLVAEVLLEPGQLELFP